MILRPIVALLAIQVVLVGGLVAWAVAGFPGITGLVGDSPAVERSEPPAPGASSSPAADPAAEAALAPRARTDRFDERRAFALLREQVQRYGHRPAGSPQLRRLAVRLRALLPRGRFEAVPGHPRLRNVVGSLPGRRPAILVGAHYDVEALPEGFVGANDGAAGTAAVVWLARALNRAKRPRGAREIRFVLFDGEEEPAGCEDFLRCGLRGSKAYAKRHARKIGDMILLDYIAEKTGLRFTREAGSDAGLWRKLRSNARAVGVGSIFSAQESGQIIDDHFPFTERGVTAIDLIDFEYPHRDTLRDTVDKTDPRSLDAVGEAVYRLVTRLRSPG